MLSWKIPNNKTAPMCREPSKITQRFLKWSFRQILEELQRNLLMSAHYPSHCAGLSQHCSPSPSSASFCSKLNNVHLKGQSNEESAQTCKDLCTSFAFHREKAYQINIVCVGIFTMKLVKYAHKHSSDQGLRMGSKMKKKTTKNNTKQNQNTF